MADGLKNLQSMAKKTSKRPPQGENLRDEAQQPSAKKAKKNHTRQLPSAECARPSLPSEAVASIEGTKSSELLSKQPKSEIPDEVQHLASKYDFTPMSIISSSKMEHKISSVLERVSQFSFVDVTRKPSVVILHAQAKDASKLVTIAEVSKREIEKEKGKWWQYTKLVSQLLEMKVRQTKPTNQSSGKTLAMWEAEQAKAGIVSGGVDSEMEESPMEKNTDDQLNDCTGMSGVRGTEEEEEEEEEVFETMIVSATNLEAVAVSEIARKRVRAVPMMMIYLARVPIPGLKELYGEQTNSSAS